MFFTGAAAKASPTTEEIFYIELSGHRWGLWTLYDTPSHDYLSEAFRNTQWISVGESEETPQVRYTYWVLGFGPNGAIYMSRVVCLVGIAGFCIGCGVYFRKKT